MIVKMVSVNRIDRGRACRAWEAFSLLIVSPVVVDRQQEYVRRVRFKPYARGKQLNRG
jgi:hypothetical protein